MKRPLLNIGQMSRRRQLALGAMLLLVLLTWMAVCLVIAGVLGP